MSDTRVVVQLPSLNTMITLYAARGFDPDKPTHLVLVREDRGWVRIASDPDDSFPSFDAGPLVTDHVLTNDDG